MSDQPAASHSRGYRRGKSILSRSRSMSGRAVRWLTDDVRTRRNREREARRIDHWIALDVRECEPCRLPELVGKLHVSQGRTIEAQADRLEIGIAALGLHVHPLHASI